MKIFKYIAYIFMFTLTFMLLTTKAHAYIDPATTAMLTQILAGVLITLGVVFGVFRQKIIMFFKNISVKRTKKKIERENAKTQNKPKNDTGEKDTK